MRKNNFNKILFLIFISMFILSCSSLPDNYIYNADITNMNENLVNNEHNINEEKISNIDNTIYFDLNKYDIKSDFFNQLNKHAIFLKNNKNNKIIIEGHTDEQGTPEYNIALGEKRAESVMIYLKKQGVSLDQINIISYGKEKLAILGHSENAHKKNRRAIIIFLSKNYQ